MDSEWVSALVLFAILALGAWTLWSANVGRRVARWGRRRLRRLALALLLALAAAAMLTGRT